MLGSNKMSFGSLVNRLYRIKFLGHFFHTLSDILQKELTDCESVLDLGCGPSSPIQHCENIKYSVGVDAYSPYVEESKSRGIHTKYFCKSIQDLDFPERSFDAVVLIEVLEHMKEKDALIILKKSNVWAKKKVILTTPNGFIEQKSLDDNELQKHLSGWSVDKLRSLGFKIRGLAGLKYLRSEAPSNTMGSDITVSIRFRPRFFWFVVATLSQAVVFWLPSCAFELFCVYNKEYD